MLLDNQQLINPQPPALLSHDIYKKKCKHYNEYGIVLVLLKIQLQF